jgi:SAM-dependent methyltransferase
VTAAEVLGDPRPEPSVGDAFGDALLWCHAHGGAAAIVERDDGFIGIDDTPHYFAEPDEWDERSRWALERARGRVLDLGAGAGRAALALQARGHDVLALDVSRGALEVCRRRGVRDLFLGTVGELASTEPRPFDTILALGNNLGLLGNGGTAPDVLDALSRVASPGATIVGTGLDPYDTTDPEHLAYHERNRERLRHPGCVTIRVRHRHTATDWFDLLWCSIDELAALCEPAGWTISDVLPGTRYAVVLERRVSHARQ